MLSPVLFSHKSDEWTTPKDFFDRLDAEFHFDVDAASSDENALCRTHFTAENDGLKQDWGGHHVWVNPPYSQIIHWTQKAFNESRKPNTVVVMLVPARTSTRWFQNYCYYRAEVRFVRGRLKFGGSPNCAPFDSMLIIWRGPEEKT